MSWYELVGIVVWAASVYGYFRVYKLVRLTIELLASLE